MPCWEDFQRKHVLDPRIDQGYLSWGKAEWNLWLQNRLPNEFGRKRVNSVVVSVPEELIQDFKDLNYTFTKTNFYWSNNPYRVFALTIDHNLPENCPYRVYDFGEMFILALISRNPNVPVHFEAQNTSRVESGKPNINFSNYSPISN